jgi:hypothetical protein
VVTFVFSNPRHHVDMMVPVARELSRRGTPYRFVSLAELRGFATPDLKGQLVAPRVARAMPRIRRDPSVGAGLGTSGGTGASVRRLAKLAVWHAALGPRMRWLLRGSDVVVVPNDAAFPYGELVHELRVPFVLLQEGIRFPLPNEQAAGRPYGGGGAAAVCAWGEASAEHFRTVGAQVAITGNPRFDGVDPATWRDKGAELAKQLGVERPLLYLSNTIDDQGFCTTEQKMQLFESFVRAAAPIAGGPIVVKLHAREDADAFRAVAARTGATVHVLKDEPLFAVLAMGRAAVVLASTVGLEALAFGLPLAVLEIPNHGHVFEYVERGVAIPLRGDDIAGGVRDVLARPLDAAKTSAFLERHMAHRGHAAEQIADRITEIAARRADRKAS